MYSLFVSNNFIINMDQNHLSKSSYASHLTFWVWFDNSRDGFVFLQISNNYCKCYSTMKIRKEGSYNISPKFYTNCTYIG